MERVDPRECCRRLTAICDLLDVIGWSEEDEPASDIHATEHAHTLTEVVSPLLATLTSAVSEAAADDPEKATSEEELRWLSGIYKLAREALNA
jgi:hypothetical protein